MKKTNIILVVLAIAFGASAMRSTNTVTGTVDTRDYIFTITASGSELFPSQEVSTNSWRSSVSSSITGTPVINEERTILKSSSGFIGEGISPASGTVYSVTVVLTNVNAELNWQWDTSYRVFWEVSGQGTLDAPGPSSGGWYEDDGYYVFHPLPDAGWLFTGWSGGASGGPSATNLVFTPTESTTLIASFSDDPDGDGLKNTNEWAVGANPWMADTDGDDYDDLFEFNNGLSPTVDSTPFVSHILDNSETYGLYPSNAVLDIAVGQVAMDIEGTTARLRLQVEKSEDLVTWTNAGEMLEWTLDVDSEKKFLRVRSAPGE